MWKRIGVRVDEMRWLIVIAMLLFANGTTVKAQDTRQVTEPKIPASCAQLPAQLRAMGDKLAEADESKLDTARIQSALDKCKRK
jgi:polygalacturonase